MKHNAFKFLKRFTVYTLKILVKPYATMPREPNLNQELQKIRLKIKEKGLKYSPGTVSLQVLGTGAPGAPRSLYLFTDQSRYLFNVGEGTQRLAHEHKMKLSKLEHIFITRPTWENMGGLPGVSLTIQDVGVPEITLHGPAGTHDIFTATRRFVVLKDLSIKMAECKLGTEFDDNVMSVKYVPITAPVSQDKAAKQVVADDADDVDYYGHEDRNKKIFHPEPEEPIDRSRIPPQVMCYICKLKTKLGTLNLESCVERGVPPGPLLGRLKNGEDITLPNGTLVKSSDVTSPEDRGPTFIVVECPSEEFLTPLITDPAFKPHQTSALEEDQAYAIIHFTPEHILQSQPYQQWISQFPPSTINLAINESNKCTGSIAVHRMQHQLNLLQPCIFPLLPSVVGDSTSTNSIFPVLPVVGDSKSTKGVSPVLPSFDSTSTMEMIHLRPKKGRDSSQTLSLTPESYVNESFNNEEFQKELEEFKRRPMETERTYPRVTFLGTGSCIPNKTRNTSGILIDLNEESCCILDCGEGTFGQIERFFGDRVGDVMRKLKFVYVSHLHADHHIGLVGVLKGRRKLLGPEVDPVLLLAPKQIMSWLSFYHSRFEDILDEFMIVPNGDLSGGNTRMLSGETEKLIEDLGFKDIATVLVRHCPNAFGITLTHADGWRLTYSGDTMPSQDLVALGVDSDILIHEATMEDELEAEARYKYHSTTSQALEVGRAMRAKFTLLTHFSQRYAKLPRLPSVADNVGIAFDNMQVAFNELHLLAAMHPALKLMFADHCEEMDLKAARRSMRKEKRRVASLSPPRDKKIHLAES